MARLTAAQKKQNELINKAKEIRLEHHGVDMEELKPWDELSEEKKQRWLDEATEALSSE